MIQDPKAAPRRGLRLDRNLLIGIVCTTHGVLGGRLIGLGQVLSTVIPRNHLVALRSSALQIRLSVVLELALDELALSGAAALVLVICLGAHGWTEVIGQGLYLQRVSAKLCTNTSIVPRLSLFSDPRRRTESDCKETAGWL